MPCADNQEKVCRNPGLHRQAAGFPLSPSPRLPRLAKAASGPSPPSHKTSLGMSRSYQDYTRTCQLPLFLKKWGSQKRNWALLHDRRDPEETEIFWTPDQVCWGRGGFITPGFPRGKADKPQNHCKSLLFPEWEIPMCVFTQSLGPPPSASFPTGLQSWVPVLTSLM